MALRDQPYIPLYVQDFLTDEKLNECSAETHGVYIKIMCIMHKSEEYGTILLKQKDKHDENVCLGFAKKLVKHLPFSETIIFFALEELINENVIQLEGDKISQRRMVKDNQTSLKRAKAGKKGGSKTQFAIASAKAKSEATTENESEYVNEGKSVSKDKNEKYSYITEILFKRISDKRQIKFDDTKLVNWNNTVRLMVDRDKRKEDDIVMMINECHDMAPTKTGFTWANNILSMDTLRKKWNDGKIYIGMNSGGKYTPADMARDLSKDYGGLFNE